MNKPHLVLYVANAGAIASAQALLDKQPTHVTCRLFVENDDYRSFSNLSKKVTNTRKALLAEISKSANSIDALILGPRHDSDITQQLLFYCQQQDIPTIFITDHWGRNYESIYSSGVENISPTMILAIDEYVSRELIEKQITTDRIEVVGHIGIRHKLDLMDSLEDQDIRNIRNILSFDEDSPIVLVVLEIILNNAACTDQYWMIREVSLAIQQSDLQNATILVRPHPSDLTGACEDYINRLNLDRKILLCPPEIEDWKAVAASDFVVGSNSTLLALSASFGIPSFVITYGAGARSTIPWLKSHRVSNFSELQRKLTTVVSTSTPVINWHCVSSDALDRAWSAICSLVPSR